MRILSGVALAVLLLCGGCDDGRRAPPPMRFEGLPISGSAADAVRAGFTKCIDLGPVKLRCRKHDVMLLGEGPFEAAVDLVGYNARGGFYELTLWKDGSQEDVYKLAEALQRRGWMHCETGDDHAGDQDIYTRAGVPVRASMDLSYYGKRRFRIMPLSNRRERDCKPYWTPPPERRRD
jgi:hypothetical protein